ncbi:hypothetical protein TNCV_4027021 [Trichonephila clavipes]|nr:hypothetical protein TNCV_4027021 [Trichonephila clavipes]
MVTTESISKKAARHHLIPGPGVADHWSRLINLKVDSVDSQELLDSNNQEQKIDEFRDMHEQEPSIEELESLDPVQSEDRMTVGNLTDGLNLIEKGLQIF